MTAAFVVTIVLDDASAPNLQLEADDIADALESEGIEVVSVNPWDRPTQGPTVQMPTPI